MVIALATNRPHPVALANPTALTDAPSASNARDVAPPKPIFDFKPYVAVLSVTGEAHEKNIEAERFNDSVSIHLKFQNLTDKMIIGLRGRVSVLDGFGKEVYSFGFRDDDRILERVS
jgi:hypothetical protein